MLLRSHQQDQKRISSHRKLLVIKYQMKKMSMKHRTQEDITTKWGHSHRLRLCYLGQWQQGALIYAHHFRACLNIYILLYFKKFLDFWFSNEIFIGSAQEHYQTTRNIYSSSCIITDCFEFREKSSFLSINPSFKATVGKSVCVFVP